MANNPRVCVIGAGPSGMSFLYHNNKLKVAGKKCADVVCYEKQSNWGGLWNYTWRTGLDEHGEPCHGSQYRDLWSNGPKECLEYPDYTFEDHFGKCIPCFPPRTVLFDYLQGRWNKSNLRNLVRFNTMVKNVTYNKDTDDFTVMVKDLSIDEDLSPQRFSNVIVATGHFSVPNVPYFDGIDMFPGRILHSHDFRRAREFKGQRMLLIGSRYSAEDISMQCRKMGSGKVICSYRTKPTGFNNWPEGIEERLLLTKVVGNKIHFKDGTTAEVDVIIFCTGYLFHFPYLSESLRLKTKLEMYPAGLYKGTLWMGDGNNKLMYLGMHDQYYSYTMFDVQAEWACAVVAGHLQLPNRNEMGSDITKWRKKQDLLNDEYDDIAFQTKFVCDLAREVGSKYNLDVAALFNKWEDDKHANIATYRDQTYTSVFTENPGIKHHTPWFKAYDDSLETFVNQTPNK
ncbi:dimethylaniline monooxygenase [N-oxide-forming] 5-like [Mizuhopecten yessoensis]|uniref:Flavin-containing monooxygenase n=1 Tax=Mizuhopecten yessoensis TaxID=6573 RepID=A0A210PHR2_MIZYE|nr:dimethylaniline monooxygenase [N-oxide-forming] 5-like [Mizuhopecten yessoensis]XP_021341345.1 dimethylaniline monooxygenase [N-oxide-forming] 5-like [Mizuhopecten yessoensis]XP_021341346.1 dimethylaniline monooxygenase [N-oxide-forming] 5-like [Mizuhopecten yessoensis]XP_021341347.1 dimethylaniline monooxygenase [N-oxide-forming] 5-like [Mizuhopecten yessoensis]XP_021341348.1 dimethylaniline monooxygenase [N-oxide-forming] 5-like [Mizuhopecten yessoensis]XP_021341349.1 dimethylaniline mono